MIESIRRQQCCFTGHRPEKLDISEREIKDRLYTAIQKAISDGYTTFISGMARGVDIWAAEIVVAEKKKNKEIKLVCASPYEGFEKKWSFIEQHKYNTILKKADFVRYVCTHYSRQCFQIRNCYMVDRSSRVIAAYNGESGGTKNTIRYANSKNVEVENILTVI